MFTPCSGTSGWSTNLSNRLSTNRFRLVVVVVFFRFFFFLFYFIFFSQSCFIIRRCLRHDYSARLLTLLVYELACSVSANLSTRLSTNRLRLVVVVAVFSFFCLFGLYLLLLLLFIVVVVVLFNRASLFMQVFMALLARDYAICFAWLLQRLLGRAHFGTRHE